MMALWFTPQSPSSSPVHKTWPGVGSLPISILLLLLFWLVLRESTLCDVLEWRGMLDFFSCVALWDGLPTVTRAGTPSTGGVGHGRGP